MALPLLFAFLFTFGGLTATARAAQTTEAVAVKAVVSDRIEAVTATVAANQLPPLVKKRMENSVAAIGDQLLTGRRQTEIAARQNEYETIIRTVFDKVLVGYSVSSVRLAVGETTAVDVRLAPWDDVIEKCTVNVTIEGLPESIEAIARRDIIGIESVFTEALVGLPEAASDWTNGVMKRHLNEFMAERLPEFRADFELVGAQTTTVNVIVYPRLPVVRTIDLSMRSDTLPNFLLLGFRRQFEARVNELLGVPVAFVDRHKKELAAQLENVLDTMPDLRHLRAHSVVTFKAAEKMSLMSRVDSHFFRLRLTGWADLGRRKKYHPEDREINFRLHAGYMVSDWDEIFGEVDFYPQEPDAFTAVGYSHDISRQAKATAKLDLNHKKLILGADYRFRPRWNLRYEYRWHDRLGEFGLEYKFHDFLGLEFALDRRERWVRVKGYF